MEKMIRPSVLMSEKAPKPSLNSFANFLSSHTRVLSDAAVMLVRGIATN